MNYTKNIGVISTLIIIVFSGIYTYLQIKKIKNLIQLNTNKIKKINITNNNNINKEICNLEHECNEYENTINKLNNLIDNESLSDIDDLQLNVNKFIQNEEKDILKNSSNIDNSKNNQDLYHIQKYNNSNIDNNEDCNSNINNSNIDYINENNSNIDNVSENNSNIDNVNENNSNIDNVSENNSNIDNVNENNSNIDYINENNSNIDNVSENNSNIDIVTKVDTNLNDINYNNKLLDKIWNNYNAKTLREMCKSNLLLSKGNKRDLIIRLLDKQLIEHSIN